MARKKPKAPDFAIWADNLDSLRAYMACDTQWRWLMGAERALRTGLDMPGARLVIWGLRCKDARQVLDDVRVMSEAAMGVFNAAV